MANVYLELERSQEKGVSWSTPGNLRATIDKLCEESDHEDRLPQPECLAATCRPAWCWTASLINGPILGALSDEPVRFNELRRLIEGISQNMLSQTLKSLERDRLVSRKAIPTVPVSVEYSITPLGRTLSATVDGLRIWAETQIDKVLKTQKQYNAGLHRKAA